MLRHNFFIVLLAASMGMQAQKSKVQAAWRALSDYEESVKDGNPETRFLQKAKESIDEALANDATKSQTRTHTYKLRVSYALFQRSVADEMKKLESSIQDKTERAITAYGAADLTEFENADKSLQHIRDTDPAYLEKIREALAKGTAGLDEDELKFATALQQMKLEAGNIASGKYKAQKYAEASDFFYRTAFMNTVLYKTKDTANFHNACIAASRAKDPARIIDYNKRMIEANIASPYNYESLFNAYIQKGDSAQAIDAMRKGRKEFPSDIGLLTQETNLFLGTGRQKEALENLKISVERDPNNALYYFIIGNIYDNLANPKDKSGRELEKPADFDSHFRNAELHYSKAIALQPANKEYLYNSLFNLGAMYNNYGGYIAAPKGGKITDAVKSQRENEAKAKEYYRKAIPNLEKALTLKPDDKPTMTALRKLYMLTGDEAKARDMSDKLKAAR